MSGVAAKAAMIVLVVIVAVAHPSAETGARLIVLPEARAQAQVLLASRAVARQNGGNFPVNVLHPILVKHRVSIAAVLAVKAPAVVNAEAALAVAASLWIAVLTTARISPLLFILKTRVSARSFRLSVNLAVLSSSSKWLVPW